LLGSAQHDNFVPTLAEICNFGDGNIITQACFETDEKSVEKTNKSFVRCVFPAENLLRQGSSYPLDDIGFCVLI